MSRKQIQGDNQMRVCGKCKGSGWYGPRTDLGRPLGNRQRGGPCRACNGTGRDNRWSEKTCRKCYGTIEYRTDWSNVPDYCENCRKDQYKSCANPHCSGTIRYKVFWDHIPDYCGCKGWFKKPCGNPHCHGQIDANCRQPDKYKYCKACKGWYAKTCENTHCGKEMKVHSEWTDVAKYCKECNGWYEYPCGASCGANVRAHSEWKEPPKKCKKCGTKGKPKFAVTKRANDGHPDHTTYSWDDYRKSYDSDQGKGKRGQHTSINGQKGGAEND